MYNACVRIFMTDQKFFYNTDFEKQPNKNPTNKLWASFKKVIWFKMILAIILGTIIFL